MLGIRGVDEAELDPDPDPVCLASASLIEAFGSVRVPASSLIEPDLETAGEEFFDVAGDALRELDADRGADPVPEPVDLAFFPSAAAGWTALESEVEATVELFGAATAVGFFRLETPNFEAATGGLAAVAVTELNLLVVTVDEPALTAIDDLEGILDLSLSF